MLCYSTTAVVYHTLLSNNKERIIWYNISPLKKYCFSLYFTKKKDLSYYELPKMVVFQIILLVEVPLKCPVTDFLQQFNLMYPCEHVLYALKASYLFLHSAQYYHIVCFAEANMDCVPGYNSFFFFP